MFSEFMGGAMKYPGIMFGWILQKYLKISKNNYRDQKLSRCQDFQ